MRRFAVGRRSLLLPGLLVLSLIGLGGLAAARAEERPPTSDAFWGDSRALTERLLQDDVGALAQALAEAPVPAGFLDLAGRIDLLTRAGHLDALEPALRALGAQPPALQGLVVQLLDRLNRPLSWRVALRACELAPHARPHDPAGLLELWRAAEPAADALAWLQARRRAAPDAWTLVLVDEVQRRWKTGEREPALALKAELEAALTSEPAAEQAARTYLALERSHGGAEFASASPWRHDLLQPGLAVACWELADRASPAARLVLLERALVLPFTEADGQRLRHSIGIAIGSERGLPALGVQFQRGVKQELARLHKNAGSLARAQALIEELAASSRPGEPELSLEELSGQIQGLTGARVVEGRIREGEAEAGDTARYWLSRALYFVGRRERAEADAAFARALDRTREAGSASERGPAVPRHEVVDHWVRWLLNSARRTEGFAVARREFEAAPSGSEGAQRLARWLLSPDAPTLDPSDPAVWRHLLAAAEWRYDPERDLLWALLVERPPPPAGPRLRVDAFERARDATRGSPAARALVLGELAVRAADLERGLPLLEEAAQRLLDRPGHLERTNAQWSLFHAYGLVGRWRDMEALVAPAWLWEGCWPLVESARVAAEQGAQADAIRIWSRAVNLDRGDDRGLEVLLGAGLRGELIAFYERLGAQDPACGYVAPILARLRRGAAGR